MGSTKYLLNLLKPGEGTLISNENNPQWLLRMQSILPQSDYHQWNNVGDSWYHFLKKFKLTVDNIDLLFIDSAPWDSRSIALDILGPKSKIVIVHDVDYFPTNNIWGSSKSPLISSTNLGNRDYSDVFTYWSEVFPNDFKERTGPPTLIGSNSIKDVENLSFENCFINSSSSLMR